MLASQENFIIPESFYWIQITVDWRRQERGCHSTPVMYIAERVSLELQHVYRSVNPGLCCTIIILFAATGFTRPMYC